MGSHKKPRFTIDLACFLPLFQPILYVLYHVPYITICISLPFSFSTKWLQEDTKPLSPDKLKFSKNKLETQTARLWLIFNSFFRSLVWFIVPKQN